MVINRLLGTEELPIQTQNLLRSALYLGGIIAFLMSLSDTFAVLYSINKIGITLSALITSIMLFVQFLSDYPSGAIGDWIGQRWVLAIAFLSYSITFLLLVSAQTFTDFALIGIINGFGNAQSSGAFNTWIDNNYQKIVGKADPEKRIYGFAMTRIESINKLALGASFLIGGFLATHISREFVFFIQFLSTIFVAVLIIIYLKDIKIEQSNINSVPNRSLKDYSDFLIGGLRFLFSNKVVFLYIIGISLYYVTWTVWGSYILLLLYFGYTGSDFLASTLRTAIFFIGIPFSFYMSNISKKIDNNKLPIFIFLQLILFFPSFICLTLLIPVEKKFNLLGIASILILLTVLAGTLFNIGNTLQQRIIIDLVPSKNRNAVYSLIPTFETFFGIFTLPIAGEVIQTFGLSAGIFIAGVICLLGFIPIFLAIYFKNKVICHDKQRLSHIDCNPTGIK